MSVPARALPAPGLPLRRPAPAGPDRRPLQPPSEEPRPSRPASPSRRAAARPRTSGVHLGFAVFAGLVVAGLLIVLVSLQVMLAQTSFHATELHARIAELSDRYEVMAAQAAQLSAPGRIAEWAATHGMVQADGSHTVILHIRGRGAGDPVSELGRDAAIVKPIVGGAG